MANTNTLQKTMTICRPSSESFPFQCDIKSRMSLSNYLGNREGDDPITRNDAQIGAAHLDAVKRFGRIMLRVLLVAVVIAGVIALRTARHVEVSLNSAIQSQGEVS